MVGSTPELRLLLALVRSALDRSAPCPAADPSIDWTQWLALAERHRLAPFLHHRAAHALSAIAPPEVRQRLRDLALAASRRALHVASELVRLVQQLRAAGIDVLAVKGLVLAQKLYGNLHTRHLGDIDLFIPAADASRADAIFRAAGLQRTRPDFELTPRQLAEFIRIKPEFEYLRLSPPLRIELLWRLEGLPAAADPWRRAVPAPPLGGQALRTLPPELDAIYLFQHGARHGWFRLFWLVDIALLLQQPAINWRDVMQEARAVGLERPLLQGTALAAELFQITPPPALVPAPAESRVIARLVAEARRQISREPRENESVGEWIRQLLYRLRLPHGVGAKLAIARPHLVSPLNWRTLPLPDRWFFLYTLGAPFLWLLRRLRRTQR